MSLSHSPQIPSIDDVYFYIDMFSPRAIYNEGSITPIIDNDGVGNFVRVYGVGTTTTVEGITVDRTGLAYVDLNEKVIVYNTLVPTGDIAPYQNDGGNRFYSGKNKAWGFNDFTWAVWHYPNTFSQRGRSSLLLDWKHNNAFRTEFGCISNGTCYLAYRITTSPFTIFSVNDTSLIAELNKWNFTLVKRENGYVKFFQNGVFGVEYEHNINYEVGSQIGIGYGADQDYQWVNYNGKIGPIITYTKALSDDEITSLYESFRGRFI